MGRGVVRRALSLELLSRLTAEVAMWHTEFSAKVKILRWIRTFSWFLGLLSFQNWNIL
jgi:hypothetical protein